MNPFAEGTFNCVNTSEILQIPNIIKAPTWLFLLFLFLKIFYRYAERASGRLRYYFRG